MSSNSLMFQRAGGWCEPVHWICEWTSLEPAAEIDLRLGSGVRPALQGFAVADFDCSQSGPAKAGQ